jgi:peptidoglycan lytic transglycosylase
MQSYARARSALGAGQLDEAERELAVADESLPELADYVLVAQARIARQKGDRDQARARYDRLLREHSESVWAAAAALERGQLALEDGGPAEALELFDRAIAASPGGSSAAALGRAQAQAALGDVAGAYAAAGELRGAGGTIGEQARALGESLAASGGPALGLEPGDLALAQAGARRREGRTSEAEDALTPLVAPGSARRAEGLLELARIRAQQGSLDEAFVAYGEASRISQDPDVAGVALYERARIRWNRDDDDDAARDFEELLARFPGHPKAAGALQALGRIAETRGDGGEAAAIYEEFARRYPTDPLANELAWRAGFVRYLAGDQAAAIRAFAALGDDEEATYWRARALEASGDRSEAHEIYRGLRGATNGYLAWWIDVRLEEPPELERRTRATQDLPAPPPALASEPTPLSGVAAYHHSRAEILRALGMSSDAGREYRAVEAAIGPAPFLLDLYRDVGAYPSMVRLARRLSTTGDDDELTPYLYPQVFTQEFADAGERSGLDPFLLLAVARQESLFDPAARSPAGARGLMQLLPATAAAVAGEAARDEALTAPAANVDVGARHLRSLLDGYDGRLVLAVAAYNAGPAAVARWQARAAGREGDEFVEMISYRETKGYVKAVLRNYRAYLSQRDEPSRAVAQLY